MCLIPHPTPCATNPSRAWIRFLRPRNPEPAAGFSCCWCCWGHWAPEDGGHTATICAPTPLCRTQQRTLASARLRQQILRHKRRLRRGFRRRLRLKRLSHPNRLSRPRHQQGPVLTLRKPQRGQRLRRLPLRVQTRLPPRAGLLAMEKARARIPRPQAGVHRPQRLLRQSPHAVRKRRTPIPSQRRPRTARRRLRPKAETRRFEKVWLISMDEEYAKIAPRP